MAEIEEKPKSLSMRMKEESEKAGLKLNIQKTKVKASSPITSWQIDGEKMQAVMDFIFLGSKITADGDCSHEIKRNLLLGRKAMTNLGSIWKSWESLFQQKSILSKVWFSSSHERMWELDHKEGLMLKNRCFWTVVLEKTLESPLDSKKIKPVNPKGSQPWVFIGRTDAEAEALNTLATWCKGPTYWKRPWYWEWLRAGGEGGNRGWDGGSHPLSITDSMDMSLSELQETVKDRVAWYAAVHGLIKSWTWLSNNRELNKQQRVNRKTQVN